MSKDDSYTENMEKGFNEYENTRKNQTGQRAKPANQKKTPHGDF